MPLTTDNITNLPVMPKNNRAVSGKDTLLYIALTNNPLTWLLVGGQKNSPMNQKADSMDASDKSSGDWGKSIPGMKKWTMDYDGLYVLDDVALEEMDYCFRNGLPIFIRQEYPDGSYRTGWAAITAFDDSHANDATSTIKVTLEGQGAISEIQTTTSAAIATPTATHVKGATTSAVIAVTPTDCTIRSLVKADGTVLANQTDYTFAAGELTLLPAFLNALATGSSVLTAKFADTIIDITVTITAS